MCRTSLFCHLRGDVTWRIRVICYTHYDLTKIKETNTFSSKMSQVGAVAWNHLYNCFNTWLAPWGPSSGCAFGVWNQPEIKLERWAFVQALLPPHPGDSDLSSFCLSGSLQPQILLDNYFSTPFHLTSVDIAEIFSPHSFLSWANKLNRDVFFC